MSPTEKKLLKMKSLSYLREGSVRKDKLFETINQEFKAQETKYQVLGDFRIYCREQGGLKVTSFRAWVHRFCSVYESLLSKVYYRDIRDSSLNLFY